ncbi:hypothetical protein Tco_1175494 [Tanacetum coccineum]
MADDQPMWGNNRVVSPTLRAVIVAVDLRDNFTVKGHHLSMIKDRQFDRRSQADPHKHITEFVEVCGMFHYGYTNADAIKLKLFPSSLAGEAKIWFNELSPDKPTQAILDARGIFLYKTLNEAHQLLEDRVLLKLDWSKENKTKPLCKTVVLAESEVNSSLLEKMEALTTRIDSQFKEIKGDMKEIRDGCNKCEGPHPSSDCNDNPIGGPKEEEANYASRGYQGGYRGNYYGRNSSNWRDHLSYHREENRNSNPGKENLPIQCLPKKKLNESEFEKTIREFVITQKTANDFVKNQFYKLKTKVEQGQKNHQAAIQDLETKFGLISDHQSSRPTDLVSNKSKMEQIYVAFLTKECSSILQNKILLKLGDPISFLIPCKLANSVEYLALADLGTSINLMLYSLYATLSGTTLDPTRMNFVILQMEEDDRVPLILGRPFLYIDDAIIRHSHVNDDTCFRMDVIDEITEDELDALVDDSKPFLNTSEKINETPLDKEFDEFMSGNVQKDEVKDDFKELPLKDELRIRTSIQDPPTDLEM